MEWNNAMKRSKFEKEQAKLRKEYLAAGMTEEQIKEMYEFDLLQFNADRREHEHTQSFDFDNEDFDDKETDNPLLKKYLEAISVTMDYSDSSRFGWIEEIENKELYTVLKSLPEDYLEILTDQVVNGYSQTEIARKRGLSRKAINNKMARIKKIFENFL